MNLHARFHDLYGYLGFLIRLPLHLHHEHPYGLLLGGFILCEEPCGYCYDRGLAMPACEKCYTLTQGSQS